MNGDQPFPATQTPVDSLLKESGRGRAERPLANPLPDRDLKKALESRPGEITVSGRSLAQAETIIAESGGWVSGAVVETNSRYTLKIQWLS